MPHPRPSLSLRAALLLAGVACSCVASPGAVGGEVGTEPVGSTREAIVNGVASTAGQNYAVLVIHPVNASEEYECTGTLLTPSLVLTARHCVSATADEGFSCDAMGNGTSGGNVGADFAPATLQIFTGTTRPQRTALPAATGAKIFHDTATNLCNHDLALISLSTPIANADIAPIRLSGKVTIGESLISIGWGVTTTTTTPDVRQQRANVTVVEVGSYTDTNGYDVPPSEFDVGESICQGDSGGPAIDMTTGAVVGVVSRGGNGATPSASVASATCVNDPGDPVFNFYSQTAAFADLITEACNETGQAPWLEGGPDPRLAAGGASCTQATDCQSNDCEGGACTAYTAAGTAAAPAAKKGCAVAGPGMDPAGAAWGWGLAVVAAGALRRRRRC